MMRREMLEHKICLLLYLAGGFFYRGKEARSVLLLVQRNYPKFLCLKFDGRFFGLISSRIEKALQEMYEFGYINKYYGVAHGPTYEPVHEIMELSRVGELRAKELLSNDTLMENAGIRGKINEVMADVLCGSVLSTGFATALSFYYSLIDDNHNIKKEVVPGKPLSYKIYSSLDLTSSCEKARKYFEGSGLVKIGPIKETSPISAYIPYEIIEGGVKKRYSYLDFNLDDLLFFRSKFEEAEVSTEAKKSLIKWLASHRVSKELASRRLKNLDKLFSMHKFSACPEVFFENIMERLEILRKNLPEIRKKGYTRVFGILEKIAKLSKMEGKPSEEQLLSEVLKYGDYASFSTRVPDGIKENESILKCLVEKVWHFGMYYHLNHFPQLGQVCYLAQKGALQR